MTGTATVVPTAPGAYTYTLSCTGMGGNVSGTTPAVTVSPSILTTLSTAGTITTIGSTVDPINGDQNPYGLTIAPATAGLITKGDLIVCNFYHASTPAAARRCSRHRHYHRRSTSCRWIEALSNRPVSKPRWLRCPHCVLDDVISAAAWSATSNRW